MAVVSPARVAAVRVVRVAKEVRVDVIVVRFIVLCVCLCGDFVLLFFRVLCYGHPTSTNNTHLNT